MEEIELDLVFREEKKETQSEWDKLVPIIAKNKIVTVFLNGEVYEPEAYNELCYTLENTNADQVRLYINNAGGILNSALSIIASMDRCSCEIVGVLSGTVSSAATMIALKCDRLEVAPHTSWLTHYYSGGSQGKGNELEAKYEFDKIQIPRMFRDLHKGFFTDVEITKVIKGKDEWLGTDEILERFARMKESK